MYAQTAAPMGKFDSAVTLPIIAAVLAQGLCFSNPYPAIKDGIVNRLYNPPMKIVMTSIATGGGPSGTELKKPINMPIIARQKRVIRPP